MVLLTGDCGSLRRGLAAESGSLGWGRVPYRLYSLSLLPAQGLWFLVHHEIRSFYLHWPSCFLQPYLWWWAVSLEMMNNPPPKKNFFFPQVVSRQVFNYYIGSMTGHRSVMSDAMLAQFHLRGKLSGIETSYGIAPTSQAANTGFTSASNIPTVRLHSAPEIYHLPC